MLQTRQSVRPGLQAPAQQQRLVPVAPRQRALVRAAAAESEAAAAAQAAPASSHRVAAFQLAEAAPAAAPALPVSPATLAIAGAVALGAYGIKKIYDTPSRTYDNNVGDEYDSWTQEGILEYYWGEHIHLGHYSEEERARGYLRKDFKQAKFDFVDEMFNFSQSATPTKILDVGCGIGGTSRHLARKFPGASVKGERGRALLACCWHCWHSWRRAAGGAAGAAAWRCRCAAGRAQAACAWPGWQPAPHAWRWRANRRRGLSPTRTRRRAARPAGITLSPNQVKRGTELAAQQGLSNASFQVRGVQLRGLAARALAASGCALPSWLGGRCRSLHRPGLPGSRRPLPRPGGALAAHRARSLPLPAPRAWPRPASCAPRCCSSRHR
jgi:hypothetical protein